jgi:hypothetical protein
VTLRQIVNAAAPLEIVNAAPLSEGSRETPQSACQTDPMKIKNRDSDADVPRAELILEGRQDVERLRRALDSYSRFASDEEASFVIPIPVPGDGPGQT